jgi:ankyrin repeat protein
MEDPAMSLHAALRRGASLGMIVKIVGEAPRSVLEADEYGALPIHTAMKVGASIHVLDCLLRRFPYSGLMKDHNGCNALHFVEPRPTLPAVAYLVRRLPELLQDRNVHGRLCLHSAAEAAASADVLRFLAEQYPQALDEYDSAGYLPLHRLFGPDVCIVRVRHFVELDGHFNVYENHPQGGLTLHCAVRHKCRLPVIYYFFQMWPESVRVRDLAGRCPLFHHFDAVDGDVLDYGSDDVLQFLIDQWADSVNEIDDNGNTVLHHAVQSRATDAAVEQLVQRSPDTVWIRNNHGCLPLHSAVDQEDPSLKMLEILVGEEPALLLQLLHRDNLGRLPIDIANKWDFPEEVIQLLTPPSVQGEEAE